MNNASLVIYHNPRCSKSRETLHILENSKQQELKKIIAMLGLPARDLVRTTEQVYEDAGIDMDAMSEDEIIAAICQHPALLQRPIVVAGNRAIIGRPPARVMEIIA
jgi:arsenate reductase